MARKLYDAAVKVGEYTTQNGQTKSRYLNIGVVMEGDRGPYLLLQRTFNPAGVPSQRDTIIVSLFEPRADGDKPRSSEAPSTQSASVPAANQPQSPEFNDDIPF
jgi:hypothetical protein